MTNYFELYELPVSFNPDAAVVKSKYYELSRKYHPDRFAQASASAMTEALRMAALNNDAYKTLKNPDATMAYILKLDGLLEDEEKYSLPPTFLMEMMDLNEAISDYEQQPDDSYRTQAEQNLAAQLQQWDTITNGFTDQYNAGDHTQELLLQIKDMYFRKKYLLRIQERIATFASH